MPLQVVKIDLNPVDAELFVQFRKYQDIFAKLAESGAFDIHGGSFTAHFDADGILRKIDRSDTLYRI